MDDVRKIIKHLKQAGYEVAYDWTESDVKLPYRTPEHRVYNLPVHKKMIKNAAEADVFILLDDESLRGAYIELGAFLRDSLDDSKQKRAYIVGPDSHKRQSIFESPQFIKFLDTIEEVYADLGV